MNNISLLPKELTWLEYDKFKNDYKLSLKNNFPFHVIINNIMNDKGITIEALQEKSKIDRRTICRLRSGKIKTRVREMEYTPTLKTIVAFCIACDMDILNSIKLLDSIGMSFKKTSIIHYAYCYLIVHCRGEEIYKCNNILHLFKIDKEYLLHDD